MLITSRQKAMLSLRESVHFSLLVLLLRKSLYRDGFVCIPRTLPMTETQAHCESQPIANPIWTPNPTAPNYAGPPNVRKQTQCTVEQRNDSGRLNIQKIASEQRGNESLLSRDRSIGIAVTNPSITIHKDYNPTTELRPEVRCYPIA